MDGTTTPYRDWTKSPPLAEVTWIGEPSFPVPLWFPVVIAIAITWSAAIILLGTRSCGESGGVCGLSTGSAWIFAAAGFGTVLLALSIVVWGLHLRQIGADSFGFHLRFSRGYVAIPWSDAFKAGTAGRNGKVRLYLWTGDRFTFFPGIQPVSSVDLESVLKRLGRELPVRVRTRPANGPRTTT